VPTCLQWLRIAGKELEALCASGDANERCVVGDLWEKECVGDPEVVSTARLRFGKVRLEELERERAKQGTDGHARQE
jgi:hypothetical protein